MGIIAEWLRNLVLLVGSGPDMDNIAAIAVAKQIVRVSATTAIGGHARNFPDVGFTDASS